MSLSFLVIVNDVDVCLPLLAHFFFVPSMQHARMLTKLSHRMPSLFPSALLSPGIIKPMH